jgi:hypothetical protein
MEESSTKLSLALAVGDQSFRVRVLPEEVKRFEEAARIANEAIERVKHDGPADSGPRILAMALFQLALDLEEARLVVGDDPAGRERLRQLIDRIDQATSIQP